MSSKTYSQSGLASDIQLGKRGPRLRDVLGSITARDATNTAFATVAGADPVVDDHLSTKRYVDAQVGERGAANLNFGAFPGGTDAATIITGQSDILLTSFVEAWLAPADTAHHSIDEHMVDSPSVFACDVVAGVGFTIHGWTRGLRLYGNYNVQWRWR